MGKKWFWEKLWAPLIVGGALALGGLFTSYFLFVTKSKHEEKMLGYSDGHYYTTKHLKAIIQKSGSLLEFKRSFKYLFFSVVRFGDQERKDLISAAQLTLGSLVFNHWQLIKNNNSVEDKDITAAFREINEGLRRSPDKIQLYWFRGLAYFQLQQFDLAVIDFQCVLEKWPYFVKAGLAMATAYCKLHLYEDALGVLQRLHDNGLETGCPNVC